MGTISAFINKKQARSINDPFGLNRNHLLFLLVPNGVFMDYWVEVKAEPWPRVIFSKTFDLETKIKLRSLKRSSHKKWGKRRRIVFHDFSDRMPHPSR